MPEKTLAGVLIESLVEDLLNKRKEMDGLPILPLVQATEVVHKIYENMQHLLSIGADPAEVENWGNYIRMLPKPLNVLDKFEKPTAEAFKEWKSLPKTKASLKKIKLPLLCGWTPDEVIEAMVPCVQQHTSKFKTTGNPNEDCEQLGRWGVFDALKCDAGLAHFYHHAFLHIKTRIRRESATNHVIRETEKRPSKTEVRRIITAWLSNKIYEFECDRFATQNNNEFFSFEKGRFEENSGRKAYSDFGQLTSLIAEHKHDPAYKAVVEKAQQTVTKIKEQAKKSVTILKKKNLLVSKNFLKDKDYTKYSIQKTGQKDATMLAVNEAFKLSNLETDELYVLFDFLDAVFNMEKPTAKEGEKKSKGGFGAKHIFAKINLEQLQTVGDVVAKIARPPNFKNGPRSFNVENDEDGGDEEFSNADRPCAEQTDSPWRNPAVIFEDEFRQNLIKETLNYVRSKIFLTPEQDMVHTETWGIGVDQKNGSAIADHFGKLLFLHSIRELVHNSCLDKGDIQFVFGIDSRLSEPVDKKSGEATALQASVAEFKSTFSSYLDIVRKKYIGTQKQKDVDKLVGELGQRLEAANLKSVSRQRVMQYVEIVNSKFREALYETHFVLADNPKQVLMNAIENTPSLTNEEVEILKFLNGLDGHVMTMNEVAKDLDCIYEDVPVALAQSKKLEILKEKMVVIKNKLISSIYY